jgi:cysteine sulfinate desulfinase/cysteine desulfurase-like protein
VIYLDYAANTPADDLVIKVFSEVSKNFIANPNSPHELGIMANERLMESTKKISRLLNVSENEIIYTSGASESNNLEHSSQNNIKKLANILLQLIWNILLLMVQLDIYRI